MTGPEYDAELEAFLKRRSPMHRRLSDIDHAEPSSDLDRIVLSRAREAIDAPGAPLFRSSRWALPIGLAATILIAFTVVLNIDHRGNESVGASPAAQAAPIEPAIAHSASMREVVPVEPRLLSDSSERRGAAAEAQATALAKRGESEIAADAARSAPQTASTASPVAVPDPHATPDSWLREINRLRAAGRTADADRELAAFRTAYPSHPAYSVAKPPAR